MLKHFFKKTKFYSFLLSSYDQYMTKKYFNNNFGCHLKKLKNIHKGKRCYVIGNGPSLLSTDLDKLKNEYSFASNYIYKIYDKTNWRPTYFVNSDLGVLKKMIETEEFWNIGAKKHFFQFNSFNNILKERFPDNTHFYFLKEKKKITFSSDFSKIVYDASTVTFIMLQLAIYMGFKEIILLGVDHNYSHMKISTNNSEKVNEHIVDHFFGSDSFQKLGGRPAVIDRMTAGFTVVEKFSKTHKIKIYNATRGGHLEVFERKDLNCFLEEKL